MTRLNYQPGQWRGVVAPGAVALFPTTLDGELLERIWRTLDDGHGLSGVLEALTAEFGTNLKAIPPFAVAVASGPELRVAVRGAFRIEVSEPGASSPVIVAGDEVTTWNERVVARADGFVVSSDGADSSDWFAIRSGIVLCRAVSFRMDGQSGAAASVVAVVAAPAPTPVQEPAPTETILPESVPVPEAAPAPTEAPAPASVHQPAPEPEAVGESDVDVNDTIDDVEPIEAEDFGPTVTELPDDAYDHLWGATVVKSVEEAAVRLDDDDSSDEESASAAPPSAAPAEAPTPAPAPAAPAVESFTPPASSTPSSKEWTAPPPTGLIDRVPGFAGVGAAATDWNDQSTPAVPSPQASNESDHDGLTVTVSELEAMRRLESADDAATTDGPGRIVLATGDVVLLDRPVIVGRRPRAQRVQGDVLPHLVTVPSPEQDVSRSHLEVRVEGRHVLVVDLDTTNGSVLHRAGTPPLRLSPGEAVLVLNGDIVDIGDGVTLLFEDLP
ncbi:FHA domain-containing protein [Agreia sp. VKM Ac-1783]|uniref:FHA domain-containing protein n=1 Tax=Agreia sp. VKM Ac-1783 TaxID=1938889 RepID=UPI000A2ADE09|nr:FHA domain-containing protein [Agreia sp. VKM Ac-1783]SMQ75457.1 FHA domain-containing protein [Agreia sp. VKM Ac-1783]